MTAQGGLHYATKGSAKVLARPDIGEVAIGMQADLAFFNLEDLRFSGAGYPIAVLMEWGAYKVEKLMIVGQWMIEDGRHGHMDPMQKH